MNFLPRDKQIDVVSALTEGLGIRATARITGVNRETVGKLALQVGRGCAELHDRMMVGIRVNRIECDELWALCRPQAQSAKRPGARLPVTGDQYTYIALGASSRAIIAYLTGKRSTPKLRTNLFKTCASVSSARLKSRRTDTIHTERDPRRLRRNVSHGVINKTYSVTHLNVTEASRRYSRLR